MGQSVTIGGERLGNNNKNKVYLHNYERSTHDMSKAWRSTMAPGTLVPFYSEVALPGDTFDIKLHPSALTQPTIGPLYGTYKLQLDMFVAPIRLYQRKLMINALEIGLRMQTVALPQLEIKARGDLQYYNAIDNQQINPSCILSYLGIRGLGHSTEDPATPIEVTRRFNGVPMLAYWDIYKNYYANKQEEIGVAIHKNMDTEAPVLAENGTIWNTTFGGEEQEFELPILNSEPEEVFVTNVISTTWMQITVTSGLQNLTPSEIYLHFSYVSYKINGDVVKFTARLDELFGQIIVDEVNLVIFCSEPLSTPIGLGTDKHPFLGYPNGIIVNGISVVDDITNNFDGTPTLYQFPLTNIDNMRNSLMSWADDAAFVINSVSPVPYSLALARNTETPGPENYKYSKLFSQEGLGIKTYNSDLFNNWISTEWIDGANGISEVTAVDVSEGTLILDELNMSKKVYDMLNRIAISGGSYDDWLDAVYTHERKKGIQNPVYIGGLMQNIAFEEQVSTAASPDQPLGTIAARGILAPNRRGGEIIAKIDEPSYIMGIVSITPMLDYSQGNKWDMSLKTMNDFHKPALDEIGFQDLITDQMGWWDTSISPTGVVTYKSAGKQPAWINYMTAVNETRGAFAVQTEQMYMTLNRRYGVAISETGHPEIADVTTYINPSKFNNIFADTRLDAQNFWIQIGIEVTARRKMSAKVMPNL